MRENRAGKGKTVKTYKITFPISIKLLVIIIPLLLISLGAITFLVSVLVSEDVRITAEENNFIVNRRSASEAERYLNMVRFNSQLLLDILDSSESGKDISLMAEDLFFKNNEEIAFIGAYRGSGEALIQEKSFINRDFFISNEMELDSIGDFLGTGGDAIMRSRSGELVLKNAAPFFGVPLLAFYMPRSAGAERIAIVLFSSNTITSSFGEGANLSCLIDEEGKYLAHADFELVLTGKSESPSLVSMIMENPSQNFQIRYNDDNGTDQFGAFSKIAPGNVIIITTIQGDVVFEGMAATTRRNIYLSGAVLFIAIIFIWFFSKTISVPLKELAAAALQTEGGNFVILSKPKTRDEIGFLTNSFQRMSGALEVFGRFVNREIALKAMSGGIILGGVPKYATIFFSDMRGFTVKSENFVKAYGKSASEKIVKWLNDYFTSMVDCVQKTHGTVDKFIGDAIMAHWGTANTAGSPEKDAFNSIVAALMMRTVLLNMNKNTTIDNVKNPPITIGIGINSGIVTAGQLGSEQRMEYTVIGDPVNLASRTESLNKSFGTDILITEETFKLAGKFFITEEMPSVMVKGKEKPVHIYAVINLKNSKGPKTLAELRKLMGLKQPAGKGIPSEELKIRVIRD